MSRDVEAAKAVAEKRYKTALLFSLPLLVAFGLLLLDAVAGVTLLAPGTIMAWIVVGLIVAAYPVIRYGRARKAYDRARMQQTLDRVAEAFRQA